MELDERPTEQYSDIGGLDKQIEEVSSSVLTIQTVVLNDIWCFVLFCFSFTFTPLLPLSAQLVEAIVLPMTHKERFENIGIQPPKGNAVLDTI